jgi:uncharacterized repeat protein (TIGR03803 family)
MKETHKRMDDFSRREAGRSTMRKLELGKIACIVVVFCVAAAVGSSAQTFTTLVKFNGTPQPANPSQLVAGIDGNIYGVTSAGGANGTSQNATGGTLFRMTPAGKVSVLYSFCALANCADGNRPNGLIQTANGKFYGTAGNGGASDAAICSSVGGCGTFFEIGPGHPLKTLYSFCSRANCNDGFGPSGAPLAVGRNGNIYGTTDGGGNLNGDNNCEDGCGTIYEITPTGALTTLHVFCSTSSCPEGSDGNGLTRFSDGNFYGATLASLSGNFGGGLYRITPGGDLTVLHTFDPEGDDGDAEPTPPIQAADGTIYGTVLSGGANGSGFFYKMVGGKLITLYSFCALANCADGAGPNQVIQGSDGNFYGTTLFGANTNADCFPTGCGTLFQITPTGTLTTLHSFCSETNCTDGGAPRGALIQAASGISYGATSTGGASSKCGGFGCGTIFSLSLSPSVEANRKSESVGQ